MAIEFIIPLYILIAANFLGDTFGCNIRKILKENMYAKHFLVLVAIFFVLVWADQAYADENLDVIAVQSVIVYVIFLMSTTLHYTVFAGNLLLLGATYIYHRQAKRYERNGDMVMYKKQMAIRDTLGNIAIGVIFVGFVYYLAKYGIGGRVCL
jgi:hypothetical protein